MPACLRSYPKCDNFKNVKFHLNYSPCVCLTIVKHASDKDITTFRRQKTVRLLHLFACGKNGIMIVTFSELYREIRKVGWASSQSSQLLLLAEAIYKALLGVAFFPMEVRLLGFQYTICQ